MPLITALATAIGTKAAVSISASLLRDMAGVQDEQLEALRQIRQDVTKMLDGPWRKAHLLIDEAAHARTEPARRAHLADAKDALLTACSLEPEATPRRATVSIDLALVHGLLGEPQDAQRWALRAYQDQVNAVSATVPAVVKLLNSRVSALKTFTDGDFWSLVQTSRKEDPKGTERWLSEKYERGEITRSLPPEDFMADVGRAVAQDGVAQVMRALAGTWGRDATRDHLRRWAWEAFLLDQEGRAADHRPFLAHVAIAETTTTGGRELMRLHRMVHDVHDYQRVCQAIIRDAGIPGYELRVNLSRPRRAKITWQPVQAMRAGQKLAWRGGGEVVSVAFSPDGRRLGAASGNAACVLDSQDGHEHLRVSHTYRTMLGVVWDVAFSPDGRRIATASGDHSARVWASDDGREMLCVRHLSVMGFVRGVAFSPDGQRLATASGDHTVRVWDAQDGRELLKLRHDEAVWAAVYSPDGTRIASAATDSTVRIWDSANGHEVLRISHSKATKDVAFSPDGCLFATGGSDTRLWDALGGQELTRINVYAWAVTFSPDGRWLGVASGNSARVFDVRNSKEVAHFEHDSFVGDVTFSPDGRLLATASDDETARVWQVAG
jgi:DNA-binding beta-propeller fold protein YncE